MSYAPLVNWRQDAQKLFGETVTEEQIKTYKKAVYAAMYGASNYYLYRFLSVEHTSKLRRILLKRLRDKEV